MTGSAKSQNSQMVAEQQAQAAEQRQKESERQARISQGLTGIQQAFEGAPVMGTRSKAFDWSSGGLPAGWTEKDVGVTDAWGQPAMTSVPSSGGSGPSDREGYGGGQNNWMAAGYHGGGGDGSWMNGQGYTVGGNNSGNQQPQQSMPQTRKGYFDASGKEVHKGDPLQVSETYDTGARSGGFGDDFYNKYKQGIIDYYMPQVGEQYKDAKDELTYRLARAGTGQSSVASDQTAKLAKQNDLNQAQIYSKADTGAADLRTRVAGERSAAESKLYATENPDVASNQALASVRNISLQQPELSPLADIFKVAEIGGGGFLKGANNARLMSGGGGSTGSTIGDAWRMVKG